MNTKEKIGQIALELFAQRGFEGVSVRDISGAVGIKESSIYNHYKNKGDILDVLVAEQSGSTEEFFRRSVQASRGDVATLSDMAAALVLGQLTDPGLRRFRQLLTIEQFHNEKVRAVYRDLFIDQPVSHCAQLFRQLASKGELRSGDTGAMAAQFYGPIFLMFTQFEPTTQAETIRTAVTNHITQFVRVYESR